jgi:hypothetical protein
MCNLNPELLLSDELHEFDFDSSLNGTSSRGTYNPMQFVIRLRDDIHRALNETGMKYEKVQAFSTFMHENIHWWQHVGSNIGFITSLGSPAIAHLCHRDLMTLVGRDEKYKSILAYDRFIYSNRGKHDIPEVNRILNNWHDIKYAKKFILDNKNIHEIIKDKRFFLSVGHSFHILWSSAINIIAASIDPKYNFLPKVNEWSAEFKRLENEKVQGFVVDEGLTISSLGTRAIFEGQARFNQLQYLAIALDNKYTYSDFEDVGMLKGIYVEAFNLFLNITGIDKPTDLNNSIIGLFLLVCDIAINPSDGFPYEIFHYESFIISNDPGLRFTMLCLAIKEKKTKWSNAVIDYSTREYENLSEELSKVIVCHPPLWGSAVIMNWVKENETVQILLEEERQMKFSPENLSVRLFLSKYMRFQEDKLIYPNIFCWTGKSMTKEVSTEINLEIVEKLFNKHRALFIDDIGDEIKPMLFDGYSEKNVIDTFQSFYTYNTIYDMINKWIVENGEFTYDYQWLTTKGSDQEMKDWIRNNFKNVFHIYPEELNILK